jgi:hypothetical protein
MKKIIVLSLVILFLVSMAWAQEKCEAPVWNVGDTWTYKLADGNTQTREVVDVSNDLFILKIEGHLSAYDRKTMNLKYLIDEKGKQVEATSGVRKLYDFPIVVNKMWSDTSTSVPVMGKKGGYATYENEFKIVSTEIITTPAGKFECYKIYYHRRNVTSRKGGGSAHYWYSPEVKAWVKREYDMSTTFWSGPSATNAELISYKIK